LNWYNVGKIVNTHGIRGEVRVISRTDFPEERYAEGTRLGLFMPGAKEPVILTVASHRVHKNFDLLTFEGHPNINDVEKYRDGILKVSEQDLGELDEGEYYYHEIVGCTVYAEDGREIGEVTEVIGTGANDVWAVKPSEGKMHYIPYIDDVVLEVDPEKKRIVIDPIEGLLS